MAALSGEWRGQHGGVIWAEQADISQLGPHHRRQHQICLFLKNGTVILRSRR